MYPPPKTPRDRPYLHKPSWGDVIASYAVFLAIPLSFWALSNPLTSLLIIGSAFGLRLAYRYGRGQIRSALRDRTVTVRLGETLQISVRRPGTTNQSTAEICCP